MKKPPDAKAVNPRYGTARLSDMARMLTRPRNPAAQAALNRLQGRSKPERKKELGSK